MVPDLTTRFLWGSWSEKFSDKNLYHKVNLLRIRTDGDPDQNISLDMHLYRKQNSSRDQDRTNFR